MLTHPAFALLDAVVLAGAITTLVLRLVLGVAALLYAIWPWIKTKKKATPPTQT